MHSAPLKGMTSRIRSFQDEEERRTLLDAAVPIGSAVFGLAIAWVLLPSLVENALDQLGRVTFHQLERLARLALRVVLQI